MSLITRERCDQTLELPFYGRAFSQTTHLPQVGVGGQYGLTQGVERESSLTFPYYSRVKKGCNGSIEYDPDLIFTPMLTKFQQDDFRICHFMDSTRNAVKSMCVNGPPRFRYETDHFYGGATSDFLKLYAESDI